METMYINKEGAYITIGDTHTGTANRQGVEYIYYSLREAEKAYRKRFRLGRMRFKHKRVSKRFFYVF